MLERILDTLNYVLFYKEPEPAPDKKFSEPESATKPCCTAMFLAIQFFHPKIAKLVPIVDSFQREGHTFSPDGGKKEIVLPKGHIS